MTSEEFRADLKTVIRRHDPGPDDLRELAADLKATAAKWDAMEDAL